MLQKHFPSYVKEYDKLKASGIDVIACLSVNDPFVMEEWCKHQNGQGKVVMLSDAIGNFTKASWGGTSITGGGGGD